MSFNKWAMGPNVRDLIALKIKIWAWSLHEKLELRVCFTFASRSASFFLLRFSIWYDKDHMPPRHCGSELQINPASERDPKVSRFKSKRLHNGYHSKIKIMSLHAKN